MICVSMESSSPASGQSARDLDSSSYQQSFLLASMSDDLGISILVDRDDDRERHQRRQKKGPQNKSDEYECRCATSGSKRDDARHQLTEPSSKAAMARMSLTSRCCLRRADAQAPFASRLMALLSMTVRWTGQAFCRRRNPTPEVAQTVGFGPGRSKMLYLSMGVD
jgi:hypothetical protein